MGSSPSILVTERPFEDDDWEFLISDIEHHNLVPVVGPELLIHGANPDCTLQQHLAGELVRRLHADISRLSPDRTLLEICSHIQDRRRICDAIRKTLDAANWPLPEPLVQLAGISGFDLYVSTTFDSLLYQAVKQARAATEERIYGLKRPIEDVAPNRTAAPVVFQIFGRMDGVGDCALSEEEILEFTQNLLDGAYRPQHIFDILARRNLLFLGCDFPGWLGRLLRRVLRASGDLRDSGLFAHSAFANDAGYVLFLERQGTKLWLKDSGVEFVGELFRRWREKHRPDESASVFISYAREDQPLPALSASCCARPWYTYCRWSLRLSAASRLFSASRLPFHAESFHSHIQRFCCSAPPTSL